MDRIQASHGGDPEVRNSSTMTSSSQQQYRDSEDNLRAIPERRVDSWTDEEPFGEGSTPLIHKDNNGITFDLDFDDGFGSSKSGKRRKPWMVFGLLCAFSFL